MSVRQLLKSARLAAGLTQSQVARAARTAQSAVAAYESGRRTPSVPTLERLLDACGAELELSARPRVRRGALATHELAPLLAEDLASERGHDALANERDASTRRDGALARERDALRVLYGFADDFRGSSRAGKLTLIARRPEPTGDQRVDAALAGIAELLSIEAGIPTPAWANEPERFAEPWWIASSRPAFDAYTLAHTPAALARHGVFIAREVFDRA